MIPILYQSNEVAFTSNGIGRLRDCISCIVTEERNGIYECDFEYPVNGANYELIQIGRIVGVTHDDTGDIQPFDIVSYSRPIDGVVTFHCTHISYRQSYLTVTGNNINSLSDAFTLLNSATPSNPFTYWTDKSSTGYLGCANGIPRTVRQTLGGIEGSILDAYGGEYEWDKWVVRLHNNRGVYRDFSIRYGVNMLEFQDDTDMTGTYSSCIPYWTNGEETVVASKTDSGSSTLTGRGECIPLDLSEKFETKPTTTQLKNTAKSYMQSNNTYNATKNISVSFVRLQDMGEYADYQNLLRCGLCDTINVVFPDYDSSGQFKIVKTVWDALQGRYEEMELGDLSISLADALGVTETLEKMYTIPTKTSDLVNDSGFISADSGGNVTLTGDITVYNHNGPIGEYKHTDGTHSSFSSGTSYAQLTSASLSLGAGRWIVVGSTRFSSNATGYRGAALHVTSGVVDHTRVLIAALSGAETRIQTVGEIALDSTGNVDLYAVQNSGSARSVSWELRAFRIR